MDQDSKINKIYKLLETTENKDEKNLLIKYLARKVNNPTFMEKYTTEIDDNDEDPIVSLVEQEDLRNLRKILDKTKVKWGNYIFHKSVPLHTAIENGDSKAIELLLKKGHPLWLLDKQRHTPLELACLNKDPGMIKCLIYNGANIKKILYLRDNSKNIKFFHSNVDFLILAKKVLMIDNNISDIRNNIVQKNYLDIIGLEDFTWEEFRYGLRKIIIEDFPNLLFLFDEICESKNMNDYLIFYLLFDLDFNFRIECEEYFFMELDYNKKLYSDEILEKKFYNDYSEIYPEGFLKIIWYKYKK